MTEPAVISEKLLSWVWKALLIIAAAVPVIAVVFSWYENNFKVPMPKFVTDSILTSPLVFSVFIGLAVASFAVQYFLGSPATRRQDIRLRTPILIFVSPVVVLVISVFAWWQSGSSFTTTVSEVAQKPFMLGSVAGLTAGSLILALAMSAREDQRLCLKVLVTLASVFLMFGGPTYLIYALQAVEVPYSFAAVVGLASFFVGIFIFLRFVPREAET